MFLVLILLRRLTSCGDFKEILEAYVPIRLVYLKPWFLVGGTFGAVIELLEGPALLSKYSTVGSV